jgi:pyridoxamine 5'-phosphate oxidase
VRISIVFVAATRRSLAEPFGGRLGTLDERDLDPDPNRQFALWLDEARATGLAYAEAMALATATRDGRPSARMVLLKGHDERGFVFFTNLESRKGSELGANPSAALLFHWQPLQRQVRIEGGVTVVGDAESLAYFRTRPPESRLAAWASPQSHPISGRDELERRYREVEARLGVESELLPPFWGGYRVHPETMEFWQHRDNRLHDRIRYIREGAAWRRERLAP